MQEAAVARQAVPEVQEEARLVEAARTLRQQMVMVELILVVEAVEAQRKVHRVRGARLVAPV
jgi:hypothetical protein